MRNLDSLGNVRTVIGDAMFDRERKEYLNDPYQGLFQNPPLMDPEFDADKSLLQIRYRILVDGEEDAADEFHCHYLVALSTATSLLHRSRYAPAGKRLAEVEVYDSDGNLLGRDKQVRTKVNGPKGVQWRSSVEAVQRSYRTAAKVRTMGPASSNR